MSPARPICTFLIAAICLIGSIPSHAQVTTATVYGVVQDPTGAVLPGATVVATNQGTNLSRESVTDERGEFAILALPAGAYTLKIELPGFKTYLNQGLQLGAGQTVRQTFSLAIGQLSENITVAESAPLVETASAAQQESIGRQEVTELPLARRNPPWFDDADARCDGELDRHRRRRQHPAPTVWLKAARRSRWTGPMRSPTVKREEPAHTAARIRSVS